MIKRLLHLIRTDLRSHRWALGTWVALLLLVAAGTVAIYQLQKGLSDEDMVLLEDSPQAQYWGYIYSFVGVTDPWLWLAAGLLPAWISLADPLQSPTAFWVTRPVRPRELVMARALLCLGVFVVLPAVLAAVASLSAGFSTHDTWLSAVSFALVRAGLVPLGFLAGIFWPAPGWRWAALLPLLGWWAGPMIQGFFESDYQDLSLVYSILWSLAPVTLLALLPFRRRLLPQVLFGLAGFSLVWITEPIKRHLETMPLQTPASAGAGPARVSASAQDFGFDTYERVLVELNLQVEGLPADVTAEIRSTELRVESGPSGKAIKCPWETSQEAFAMSSWYGALAHAMGVSPESFAAEWRRKGPAPQLTLPKKVFMEWKNGQELKITGQVRLRLWRMNPFWQGLFHQSNGGWKGKLRLHQAVGMTADRRGGIQWTRPMLALVILHNDTSAGGILFNPERTRWVTAFQPPLRLPDGKISREARRDPPRWADGRPGMSSSMSYFSWDGVSDFGSSIVNRDPEFREISETDAGLDQLPAALVSATAYAEIELPLETTVLTKQQILDTKKITPARP